MAERVGILFVHGIGEQERFAFVKEQANALMIHFAQLPETIRLSVIDRTAEAAKRDPLEPSHNRGDAPISIQLRTKSACANDANPAGRDIIFDLHEAWWADLGSKGGIWDQILFWIWALGQWAAPLHWTASQRRNSKLTMDPPHFPGTTEPVKRLSIGTAALLFWAGIVAITTFFSWSIGKLAIKLVAKTAPDTSLVFRFLGDVRTYEQTPRPANGLLSDPVVPGRTAIRRRVVAEVVAMAMRGYPRWHLFAHSLGTIPAFNILNEIELTLPNYLSETQWGLARDALGTQLPRIPAGVALDQLTRDKMMPMRPIWLADNEGIDRKILFAGLLSLVTYGAALDKFARLWPRTVLFNKCNEGVFPKNFRWINLYEPTDPVADRLLAFGDPAVSGGLSPTNIGVAAGMIAGVSHLGYFRALNDKIKDRKTIGSRIAGALCSPSGAMDDTLAGAAISFRQSHERRFLAILQYLAATLATAWAAAAVFRSAAATLLPEAMRHWLVRLANVSHLADVHAWLRGRWFGTFGANIFEALLAAAAIVLLCGLIRSVSETQKAAAKTKPDATPAP